MKPPALPSSSYEWVLYKRQITNCSPVRSVSELSRTLIEPMAIAIVFSLLILIPAIPDFGDALASLLC